MIQHLKVLDMERVLEFFFFILHDITQSCQWCHLKGFIFTFLSVINLKVEYVGDDPGKYKLFPRMAFSYCRIFCQCFFPPLL